MGPSLSDSPGAFPAIYMEKIYAGVLGKIIGVYLGRPVEGWPYEMIRGRFGDISYYVHDQLGLPLIIADDDISGTFAFFRAMEDSGYDPQLSAEDVGQAWLNYIIEDKTILWWGGLGNSTEHTAYLNLKSGIKAPQSGSMAQNGRTLSEQIGAQIFMDAYAMMCPGDPEAAAHFARVAASVSHDGLALEAAGYLAAMEALAFDESDLNTLLDRGQRHVSSDYLKTVIDDVRNICERTHDWHDARAEIDKLYGYSKFSGPCHIIPNHAMVLASLIKGGNDFHRSVCIAATAAWDTDCNAGNVGCLNGIRLGLDAINSRADFRGPVADRMLVVTADGSECVTDAVREARKIIVAAAALQGRPADVSDKKFSFEFKGSVQGFTRCPHIVSDCRSLEVSNLNVRAKGENGLLVSFEGLADEASANISTPVFLDYEQAESGYETVASPLLYGTQTVNAVINGLDDENPRVRLYVVYYNQANARQVSYSETFSIQRGPNDLSWNIPDTRGVPIVRLGLEFTSPPRTVSRIAVTTIDWSGAPDRFEQRGMLAQDIWTLSPYAARQFVSSAKHFATSVNHTYTVSHPDENGVATVGTRDFTDFSITADLVFSLHRSGGLVLRSKGHRRYYALLFEDHEHLAIVMRKDDEIRVIDQIAFQYRPDTPYNVTVAVKGNHLIATVDGVQLLSCFDEDEAYSSGGCGVVVNAGTIYVHSFAITRC